MIATIKKLTQNVSFFLMPLFLIYVLFTTIPENLFLSNYCFFLSAHDSYVTLNEGSSTLNG